MQHVGKGKIQVSRWTVLQRYSGEWEIEPYHPCEWRLRPAQPCSSIISELEVRGGDCGQVPFQPFVERNSIQLSETSSEEHKG